MTDAACLLNFVWLSYDTTPPQWDAAGHLALGDESIVRFSPGLFHGLVVDRRGVRGDFSGASSAVDTERLPARSFLSLQASCRRTCRLRSLIMTNSLFVAILVVFGLPDWSTAP